MKKVLPVFIIALVLSLSNISAQDSLKIQKEKPFVTVEQMPSYPGGEAEMMKFISSNLSIPIDTTREEGLCTRMAARFVIEADGTVSDIKVVRGCGEKADRAFIDAIEKMPKWIPGRQNGKAVRVYHTIPISCILYKK